jgi:carboxyl-terminal processing protease
MSKLAIGATRWWYGLVVSLLVAGFWLWGMPTASAFTPEQQLVLEAWRTVDRAYYDGTFNHQNWWVIRERTLKQPIKDTDAAYKAIESMLGNLDEPFTRLLRPEQYRSLKVNTSGELSGVGLQIGINPETQEIEVIAPIAGSPAAKAGILPHDIIRKVDATPATELTLDEAATKMRGVAGTNISLTIAKPQATSEKEVILVRQKIALNAVTADLRTATNGKKFGYLRLSQFTAKASQELADRITAFNRQGAAAYILDLRNNPGGLLQSGIDIARELMNEGTIVYTVNRQGILEDLQSNGTALTKAPLVLLVNEGTASASEILAGALQDNHRATLVGTKTFGKGLIQSLFELPDGSGLAVTVAKYETPAGHDIHKLGILPDREVAATTPLDLEIIATDKDPQYLAAIDRLFE